MMGRQETGSLARSLARALSARMDAEHISPFEDLSLVPFQCGPWTDGSAAFLSESQDIDGDGSMDVQIRRSAGA